MQHEQERAKVLGIARSWLGTPFHDQAKLKGVGVDCAQLIAAIFEEAGLIEKVEIGFYSPQWFLHRDEERYLSYVLPRANEINETDVVPADLVVFKIGRCFAHGGIIVEPGYPHIIHAYKPYGFVIADRVDQTPDLANRERRFFRYAGWS